MTDKGALRPTQFNLQKFIEQGNKKTDVEQLSDDEKILAAGADNKFWKVLKKHFENLVDEIERLQEQAIGNGAPFDEIGRNALVISQVKGILRKVINAVEDAKEAQDGQPK